MNCDKNIKNTVSLDGQDELDRYNANNLPNRADFCSHRKR